MNAVQRKAKEDLEARENGHKRQRTDDAEAARQVPLIIP